VAPALELRFILTVPSVVQVTLPIDKVAPVDKEVARRVASITSVVLALGIEISKYAVFTSTVPLADRNSIAFKLVFK